MRPSWFRSCARSRAPGLLPLALVVTSACHDGGAPPANAPDTSATPSGSSVPDGSAATAQATPDGSGATAQATPDGSGAIAQGTLVRADDDGKTFDVAKGSTLTVSLASNAGTGYRWVPTKIDASVLAQQGDRTVEASSPGVPGGPTSEVYHFVAASAGTTVLEMSLKRAFGSGAPARTVHVTINVH
jgi:predicted secreted protein